MTTVGYTKEVMVHTTTERKVRGPYKARVPAEEKPVDFSHLDIKRVEQLVGRPAIGFETRGIWIIVDFGNCTISFKAWKSV